MRKLTLEYVKQRTPKLALGYICEAKEYINANSKIPFKCNKGHSFLMTWANFNSGSRCRKCWIENQRLTIKYVQQKIEELADGYTLLSNNYIGCEIKLKLLCSKGHEFKITWDDFFSGRRCSKCANNKKFTLKFIKQKTKDLAEGYKCLSNKYVNVGKKLEFKCDKNHDFEMSWANFQKGQRCSKCRYINMSGRNHHNWKGGTACEPYCDAWADKEYKKDIRERDGNKCLNPVCWKTGNRLCIMHINHDKKNCHPSNLITGCMSCNARANFDREFWTSWYQAIMYRRYRYFY